MNVFVWTYLVTDFFAVVSTTIIHTTMNRVLEIQPLSIHNPYRRRIVTPPVGADAPVVQTTFPVGAANSTKYVHCEFHLKFLRQCMHLAQRMVFSPDVVKYTALAFGVSDERVLSKLDFPRPLDCRNLNVQPRPELYKGVLEARTRTPVTIVIDPVTKADGLVYGEEPSIIRINERVSLYE